MTAKSVLVRPQGLRSRTRAPACSPSCYVTGIFFTKVLLKKRLNHKILFFLIVVIKGPSLLLYEKYNKTKILMLIGLKINDVNENRNYAYQN